MASDIPAQVAEAGVESQVLKDTSIPEIAVPGVADLGAHARQSVRPAGAQIVQNHFANDAVDRDIGADAERQRSNPNSR